MSSKATAWVWGLKNVTPLQKLVLMGFSDSFGCGDGDCEDWEEFSSTMIKRIANFCNICLRDVRDTVESLERKKLIFFREGMFYLPVINKAPPFFPPVTYHGSPKVDPFRDKILTRDGYTCRYCGNQLDEYNIHLDHVYPKSRGGKRTYENMVISCPPCNMKKHARTPEEAGMDLLPVPMGN